MGQPQINILSKADLLKDKELNQVKDWSEDTDKLGNAILAEEATLHREMSEGILHLITEFGNKNKLFPTGKEAFFSVPLK